MRALRPYHLFVIIADDAIITDHLVVQVERSVRCVCVSVCAGNDFPMVVHKKNLLIYCGSLAPS